MHVPAQVIDAMKTPARTRGAGGDMVAVVGKLFARGQSRSFADDFIALDHELTAVGVSDHPFASEQRDGVIGAVVNRDEIHERMRLVRRQAFSPVVIHEFVEVGG